MQRANVGEMRRLSGVGLLRWLVRLCGVGSTSYVVVLCGLFVRSEASYEWADNRDSDTEYEVQHRTLCLYYTWYVSTKYLCKQNYLPTLSIIPRDQRLTSYV